MTTFETPGPITLSIELAAGDVTVEAVTSPTTEVELRPARFGDTAAQALIDEARVEHTGDTVVVHIPAGRTSGLFRNHPEVVIAARLPVGSTVAAKLRSAELRVTGEIDSARIESASGDVFLTDVAGNARLDTASGDVRLTSIGGDLRVKTASGDVGADTCCADVSVQTASGDIVLRTVEGDLDARTASGDVEVGSADASARARTASGDVELGRVRTGRVEVQTASGEVTVGVETGTAVWLDVSSLSGTVSSTLEPTEPTEPAEEAGHTLELRVVTVSGDISLRSV